MRTTAERCSRRHGKSQGDGEKIAICGALYSSLEGKLISTSALQKSGSLTMQTGKYIVTVRQSARQGRRRTKERVSRAAIGYP